MQRSGRREVEYIAPLVIPQNADDLVDRIVTGIRLPGYLQRGLHLGEVPKAEETQGCRTLRRVAATAEMDVKHHVPVIAVSNRLDAGVVVAVFEFDLLHGPPPTQDDAFARPARAPALKTGSTLLPRRACRRLIQFDSEFLASSLPS